MPAPQYLSVLASLAVAGMVQAADPFYMCTESKCEKCPSSVASEGTGYPNCVVYNSEDVFANQGYDGATGGGYTVYFDVQQHDPGCATIIKSPADTDIVGCGTVIGSFKNAACATLSLEKTFMVQSCCGDACSQAETVHSIRGLGPVGSVRSVSLDGRGGLLLKDANGTTIQPAAVGPPPELRKTKRAVVPAISQSKRKSSCTKNSWKGGAVLTKPADSVQIMLNSVDGGTGGASVKVGTERTQTWTTSMSIGIEDILSLGVSTEFSQSISSSKEVSVDIPAGQSGKLGFTSTLSCSTGTGKCGGNDVSGEVCWPTNGPDGDVAGTYRVIVES